MIVTISPAKTLDFSKQNRVKTYTIPLFLRESALLIKELRRLQPKELSDLMGISSKLAELNFERYNQWREPFTLSNAKQAVLAFNGDVYEGLNVSTYSTDDLSFAQEHLVILSGLYGLLRPLDLIQPYRLEMGTRLSTARGDNLYHFWNDLLTDTLNKLLIKQKDNTVINLASHEYFRAVNVKNLSGRVITPVFKDSKKGRYKVISFFAKNARGLMTSFIIKNKLSNINDIKEFNCNGYSYNKPLSSDTELVFTREEQWQN
jgi:cytoplasmic iron level regulating protein YaaA (DUF328/UPF0246 family)